MIAVVVANEDLGFRQMGLEPSYYRLDTRRFVEAGYQDGDMETGLHHRASAAAAQVVPA
jgi:hypothetical protein